MNSLNEDTWIRSTSNIISGAFDNMKAKVHEIKEFDNQKAKSLVFLKI